MKIHTSVKFEGNVIGYHFEFETAMTEAQLIEHREKVLQLAIQRFKQKNELDFKEDFSRCVYFEVFIWEGKEKVVIIKKAKEMKLELKRIAKKETYTIGKLFVNDEYLCDTLEDKVRPDGVKIFGETAIPKGEYKVLLTYSNRFKKVLPLICDVPNFEGIRIHVGNTDKDTHGCILVGKNSEVGKLAESRKAMEELMSLLCDAKDVITIKIE